MDGIVLIFRGLIYIVLIVFAIIGIIYIITANKPNSALRMKLNNIWNWLVHEGGRSFSPSTNEKTRDVPENKQESSEFILQVNSINDSLKYYFSSIDNKLTNILEQQGLIREEQERLQQSFSSICTQHEQQMSILSELKTSNKTFVYNQKQDWEVTNDECYNVRSFKELYCRQLSEGKDGFKVNELSDSPNGNCYVIKQYDDTHATLSVVEDPLVRSQMITSFTDFIAPICDFDGQSPVGKDGFEVKETGELEIYNEKWLIKKKIKIQLI